VDVPSSFGTYWDAYIHVDQEMLVSEIRQSQTPAVSNTTAQEEDLVKFTVDFFYDSTPEETAWELRNVNTSNTVVFVPYVNFSQSQFASYTYNVARGYSYQLRLWDSGGDGLSDGWVNVWIGNLMMWTLGDDKDFGDEYTTIFNV
jgi:hypothetical protein